MSERLDVTVKVYAGEQYDDGFPTSAGTKLVDFIAWLKDRLEEVPEEYRDSTVFQLESEGGYEGSHYCSIEIRYVRPETDWEMAERQRAFEERVDAQLKRDLVLLRDLRRRTPG